MSKKEYKVLFIFFTILLHLTSFNCQNQSYYPKGNQYQYGVSMFNGSTMYMTFSSTCSSFAVTSKNGNNVDYFWDSSANAVIIFRIVYLNDVLTFNCGGIKYDLDLTTVDTTSSISIKKPTIADLEMNLQLLTWTYTPTVTVTTSNTNIVTLTDLRYAYYIYKYNEGVTNPDSSAMICANNDILSTDSFTITCTFSSANEGDRFYVSAIVYHPFYNLKDTLSFTIIPRYDHKLSPSPGDSTISLAKYTDTSGLVTSYRKQFTVVRSDNGGVFNSANSPYLGAITWTCSCSPSITNNCSIDNTGTLSIADVNQVTSFTVSYAISICNVGTYVDVNQSDVVGGNTCTDTYSTFATKNPEQVGGGTSFTFLTGTSIRSYGGNIPTFLIDTANGNVNYIPVFFYLDYNLSAAAGLKWVEYSNGAASTATSTCAITTTNAASTNVKAIEMVSQTGMGYYAINGKNLSCISYRDCYNTSQTVVLRSYLETNNNTYFNNFWTVTINPRLYHVGNLLVKNPNGTSSGFQFYCNYVNKFYIYSYNHKTSNFSKIRTSSSGDFDPPSTTFTVGSSLLYTSNTIISSVNYSHAYPMTKMNEQFDIVYVIWGDSAYASCSITNFQIIGNNKSLSSLYPQITNLTWNNLMPKVYSSSPPSASSDASRNSSNTIKFYAVGDCKSSTLQHCNLFATTLYRGASISSFSMASLVDPLNTYTSSMGIRWFTYGNTDANLTIDRYSGIVTIANPATFFAQTSFNLNIVALISDDSVRGSSNPNNFVFAKYTISLSYIPKFHFNGQVGQLYFDSYDLLSLSSSPHYCCLQSSCPAADKTAVTTITKVGFTHFICKYVLFPGIVNTSPMNLISGSYSNILLASLASPEYTISSAMSPKILIDSTKTILYHVIDNNLYKTERFTLQVTDNVGSIQCPNLPPQNPISGCSGTTFFKNSVSLDTYILYKNSIRINVPDRQEVLQFFGLSGYNVDIEINKPSNAGAITCSCNSSNSNFVVTCTMRSANYDQLNLTLSSNADTNPVTITVWCSTAPVNNNVTFFGVNSFTLYPNYSVVFYNDFFLFKQGATFNNLPSTFTVTNGVGVPSSNNGTNQIAYKPYFIEGQPFPYNYNVYDYKTGGSTWSSYTVINWNSASIAFTGTTTPSFYFCCLTSNIAGLSCSLKGTSPRSPLIGTEPLNTCRFTGTNNTWSGQVSTYKYSSWMDTLTCSTVNVNSTPNSVSCYDDALTVKCMPNLPSTPTGPTNYGTGYVFSMNIQVCVHNIPLIYFLTTSASYEVITGTDFKADITKYIDMRNILDGFIFKGLAKSGSNTLSFITYDEIKNIITITNSNFSTMFSGSTESYNFDFYLYDAYDRESSNKITITLNLNDCPVFNKSSPVVLSAYWYPGYPGYNYPGFTNSYALYDSGQSSSNNIVKKFSDSLVIISAPQLYRRPTIEYIDGTGAMTRASSSNDKLIEIWWDSPYPNPYSSGTVNIVLQLTCSNPNFTPNTLTVQINHYLELPFPSFITNFKPYIKCLPNSSTLTFYNSQTNNVSSHFDNTSPSFSLIDDVNSHYLNTLAFSSSSFPNVSSKQVSISKTSGTYQLSYDCQSVSNVSTTLSNIPISDTNLPSPMDKARTLMIFKNKFYLNFTTTKNHSFLAYYRFFPYDTINFQTSTFEDTFVTLSTFYIGNVYISAPVNDIAVVTDTCSTDGGLRTVNVMQNLVTMKNLYPALQTVDNTTGGYTLINTANLCALYDEVSNNLYFRTENSITNPMNIQLNLYYYPHFGMESNKVTLKMYKWTKSDIKFVANVYDYPDNNVMIQNVSGNNLPTNILVTYGTDLNSFMRVKYSYTLSDSTAKFTPVIIVNVLDTKTQLYDTSSNTFKSDIKPLVTTDYTTKTITISFSKTQQNSQADNYKSTIHANFFVKSHSIRWDYVTSSGGVNIKLYSDDLENLRNLSFPSYSLFNSFYLNLVYVPNRLYLKINKIDPVTLVSTNICSIDDTTYYDQYKTDLSDYYNSSSFTTISSCDITSVDTKILILQIAIQNVSDFQDYVYTISSSPAIPNCNNMSITQNLLVGDYLYLDIPKAKFKFPTGTTSSTIDINVTVNHKNFNINTSANKVFNYLELQKIQQWVNFKFVLTIEKEYKIPRVQKFWSTSSLIYDRPSTQALWATENIQYTYNFNILSDNELSSNDTSLWSIDKHNAYSSNPMSFSIKNCTAITPSCTPNKQQEDYNYVWSCPGSFSWKPNTYQFDSSLIALKITDSIDTSLFSYYYFNIGHIAQQNDMPKMTGVMCQKIAYGVKGLTNQQLTECSKDSANSDRYIIVAYQSFIVTLLWSDTDSYPINPLVNTETSYNTKANSLMPLYPPQLSFSMTVSPSNAVSGFTQLTYDTWMVKLSPTEMNYVVANLYKLELTYTIQDDMYDLDSTGANVVKNSQTTTPFKYTFTVDLPKGVPYVKDTFSFSQYDSYYWLIPRIFYETMTDSTYAFKKYSFSFTLYNEDFISKPTTPFNYNLSVTNCPEGWNSDLNFETSTGADAATKSFTIVPSTTTFLVKMTWKITDHNNSFNTAGCQLTIDDGTSKTDILLSACQYFWCRNRNIIYSITGSCSNQSTCIYGNSITLTGQNFPATSSFTTTGSQMMIGNAECNNPQTAANGLSMTCTLPNIGGRNHLVWLWRDPGTNTGGFPAYSITYPEPYAKVPKITSYYLFLDANYYYVNYPKPINVYGSDFRSSCQCAMDCGDGQILYPNSNVKSPSFIECDYNSVLTKSSYLKKTCSLNIRCLDHASYKATGDVYDLNSNSGDIIYISAETLMIVIDEVTYTRVNFSSMANESLNEDYTPTSNFKPHRHGGYQIKITYDKAPECFNSTTGCKSEYFFIKITQEYVVKANCQIGNDGKTNGVFFCKIIAPRLNLTIASYMMLLSWDRGLTFADSAHSPTISVGTLCGLGYYCPAYKIIPVDKGHFCDIIPTDQNSLYCKYQRKCPAGFYQDQIMQSSCKPVPPGKFLNYFGSDGTNPPPKPCPKGYVCREEGLAKYYEICRPGHLCDKPGLSSLNMDQPNILSTSTTDQFCFTGNFCPLGVMFTPSVYQYGTASVTCQLEQVLNITNKVYNMKDFQRLYNFRASINYHSPNFFIIDLCSSPCRFFTVCSLNDYYYDISGTRSIRGQYRPPTDCAQSPFPDQNPQILYGNNIPLTAAQLFSVSKNSTRATELAIYTNVFDRYINSCYYNPSCGEAASTACCDQGACWCPPGFSCDVEDLNYPIICTAGFWRYNDGYTDVAKIKNNVGPNILDFIDFSTAIYKEYSTYFVEKYASPYISASINELVKDGVSTLSSACILCPPGYYCVKGAVKPALCSPGFYCEHQFASPLKCKQGYYNELSGQYKCKVCPIGKICPTEGMSMYSPCPPGYFCPRNTTGTIDPNYKGTDFNIAEPCPESYFCPGNSGEKGDLCPKGKKCPKNSAQPIPCAPGTFQNTTGMTFCYDCPRGFYCMNTGMEKPEPCDAGRICNGTRLTSATRACTPGYICDSQIGLVPGDDVSLDFNSKYPSQQMKECDPGYYCNAGTISMVSVKGQINTPQKCNLGEYNPLTRQSKCLKCPAGYECISEGLVTPTPCKMGFYRENSTYINCQPCKEGTYGTITAAKSADDCTKCPSGVVCIGLNMTIDVFRSLNESYWKLCPEGYICKDGTSLSNMNSDSCPSGKFCQAGAQNTKDANSCPAGRVCSLATSVSSKAQLATCSNDDPKYCYVGDVCLQNYFCPRGTAEYSSYNSCYEQTSFAGARDRFFCSLSPSTWDSKMKTVSFQTDAEGNLIPVYPDSPDISGRLLQSQSESESKSKSESETKDLIDKINCMTLQLTSYETKILSFNFTDQVGFPPENYDFVFKVNKTTTKISTFQMFDSTYDGSMSEIPLYPDAKLFLMKSNFQFKLKITSQAPITVGIYIKYNIGPYFNKFYNPKIIHCSKLVKLEQPDPDIESKFKGSKNNIHFFSISKSFIFSTLNIPHNMMAFKDKETGQQDNLFMAAISMYSPNILDFINYKSYNQPNQRNFNSTRDYYIYKNIEKTTAPIQDKLSLFGGSPPIETLFGTNDTNVDLDRLITTYIPFISNCEVLGSHITLKNMLSHPSCKLVEDKEIQTFSFMSLFASVDGDNCDYSVKCFYDERFDSPKVNWMQFDYGVLQKPLFNISQYGMSPDVFNQYAQKFYMKIPKYEDYSDTYDEVVKNVPVRVKTEIASYQANDPGGQYFPRNVTFTVIYYTTSDGKRKIIKSSLELSNFQKITSKDDIQIAFNKMFNVTSSNPSPLSYNLWQFFRDSINFNYMGDITNYMINNYYQNTSQFKSNFSYYNEYKSLSEKISNTEVAGGSNQVSGSSKTGASLTNETLSGWISKYASDNFAASESSVNYKTPPNMPDSPRQQNEISPIEYYNQYTEAIKDYMNNAYTMVNHIYDFKVVIRPASWLEALNYSAFPIDNYIILAVLFLVILNINYFLYFFTYKIPILSRLVGVKINSFSITKIKKMKFYDAYEKEGQNVLKSLMKLILTNIAANIMTTLPIGIIVGFYMFTFSFSGWFIYIPANYKQKSSDYNNVRNGQSDSAVEAMLKTNQLARIGYGLFFMGIFFFLLFIQKAIPDYPQEFVQKSFVKDKEIRKRKIERREKSYGLVILIAILIFIIYQITNFFVLGSGVSVFFVCFFMLFISPLIYNIFDNDDSLFPFVINTVLSIANFILILGCQELNVMLLLFLMNQFFKFFKIVMSEEINRFFKFILENSLLKKNKKDKLVEKIHNLDSKVDQDGDEAEITALNQNIKLLTLISSDLSISFILVPFIFCYWAMLNYIYLSDQTTLFNIQMFMVIVCLGFGLDFLNYLLILKTSNQRDVESNSIYKERNSVWALNSTSVINKVGEYRIYDKKYESIRRLGFSSQLFVANILFGSAFAFIYLGINTVVMVKMIPWHDVFFFLFVIGCKYLYVILLVYIFHKINYILMNVVANVLKIWKPKEIQIAINEKVRKMKDDLIISQEKENEALDSLRKLDALAAQLRAKIGDLWANESMDVAEKKVEIGKLLEDVKIQSALHKKTKDELNEELQRKTKEDQDEKRNLLQLGNSSNYDIVPNISKFYSDLSLKNFNREVNLILSEMTGDNIDSLANLENKYKIRYDIMSNLNLKTPDKFLEDIGVKKASEDNKSSRDENRRDSDNDIDYDSHFEISRPMLLTEMVTQRRTTIRSFNTEGKN